MAISRRDLRNNDHVSKAHLLDILLWVTNNAYLDLGEDKLHGHQVQGVWRFLDDRVAGCLCELLEFLVHVIASFILEENDVLWVMAIFTSQILYEVLVIANHGVTVIITMMAAPP